VKFAIPNWPPLKKLNLRMDHRGKSIKKKSSNAMKMVTVGTMNLSISILADEIPYSIGTAYSFGVVFIVQIRFKLIF
jgi:hypothetical protein